MFRSLMFAGVCLHVLTLFVAADETPAKVKEPVPKGEVTDYSFDQSKIFPGTSRKYWVYVPKQYDPLKPACLYVNQDGIQYNAPAVFDELIASHDIPITIGVFIQPGVVKAIGDSLDRFNRSFEYDGLGDNYVRFLEEELLPDVQKKTTADGRQIHFSSDGNDRCIGGSSSGAICAFTAAWEHPKSFQRVFSAIGTYVGLRGGHNYPTLIRKYEPKPIRIFLQGGSQDQNIYAGDWWMANQEMERSLTFAGYEVEHVWGDGGHNTKHATEVFPQAMRWLWKDWPAAVKAGAGSDKLQEILIPGEDWALVSDGYTFTEGPAANAKGEVYFNDVRKSKTYKIDLDGKVSLINEDSKTGNGQAFGADGRRYEVAEATYEVVVHDDDQGTTKKIAEGFHGNDIVVRHDGGVYVSNPVLPNPALPGNVWYISPQGEQRLVDPLPGEVGMSLPNGICLSPDQSLLYVAESRSHWIWSYQIQPDGSLAHRQRYFHLAVPDRTDSSGVDGIRCDIEGRLFATTSLGIQVFDQAGRLNCIIPTPNGRVANLCFGGDQFNVLFAMCGDKVYRRKVKIKGANSFEAPIKPKPPKL